MNLGKLKISTFLLKICRKKNISMFFTYFKLNIIKLMFLINYRIILFSLLSLNINILNVFFKKYNYLNN